MAAATIMAFRIEISSCTMLFNHSAMPVFPQAAAARCEAGAGLVER
jgi:hypothetical protein